MKRTTLETVKQAIRAGYAWPGGYRLNIVMADGELLCTACARENYRLISCATRHGCRDGWAAVGADVHWEGAPYYCAHCNTILESEYGNPEEETAPC